MTTDWQVPQEVRFAVLASYASSGNASAAAREHDVAVRTGRRIVAEALSGEDERGAEFLASFGRRIRAQAIDAAERAIMGGIEIASERMADPQWPDRFKGADPTPGYLKAVTDAHKALVAAERLEAERTGDIGHDVTITVLGPDGQSVSVDPFSDEQSEAPRDAEDGAKSP